MFYRYDYEAEYYVNLSRLPLDLRRKLDRIGVKLSLKSWLVFSIEERTVLCHLSCDSLEESRVFTAYLEFLCRRYDAATIEATEPLADLLWEPSIVPSSVAEKSAALGCAITLDQWRSWQAHERYALYKTATSKSQPEAFEQVLQQLRQS
jgi:hypothetical protein